MFDNVARLYQLGCKCFANLIQEELDEKDPLLDNGEDGNEMMERAHEVVVPHACVSVAPRLINSRHLSQFNTGNPLLSPLLFFFYH